MTLSHIAAARSRMRLSDRRIIHLTIALALDTPAVTFLKLSGLIIDNLQDCRVLYCLPGRDNAVNTPTKRSFP